MSSLIIHPVETSKDWRDFARLKNQLYPAIIGSDQSWDDIGKLKNFARKNLYNKMTAYLAVKEGEILGRIVALVDGKHNPANEGFFGFFESINELVVAKALLQTAGGKLWGWGKKHMLGPISPSTNDKVGILTKGFEISPHPNLNYNPPYYQQLLEEAGLTKSMGLLSYLWSKKSSLPVHFNDLASQALKKNAIALYFPARYGVKKEASSLVEVYNESLSQNWGYVPLTLNEAENILSNYKNSPEPDYLFYLIVDGEIAGLTIIQPNYRQNLNRETPKIRVAVMGLKPEFRKKGLSTILIFKTTEFLQDHGYPTAEISLIMENNQTVRGLLEKTLNYPVLHHYQVYQCDLPL